MPAGKFTDGVIVKYYNVTLQHVTMTFALIHSICIHIITFQFRKWRTKKLTVRASRLLF